LQPGLFLDYLAFPHKIATHLKPLQAVFDFQGKRAIVVDGHEDAVMPFMAVSDLAAIVAKAVNHEDTWPKTGDVVSNRLSFSKVLEIGAGARGKESACHNLHVLVQSLTKHHRSAVRCRLNTWWRSAFYRAESFLVIDCRSSGCS